MKGEVVYYPDIFPDFAKNEYIYQLVEKRRLSPTLHRHTFYEIILMLQGKTVQQVDGRNLKLMKGELVFLSPENEHCFLEQSEDCILLGLSIFNKRFLTVVNAFGFEPVYGKNYIFISSRFSKEQLFQLSGTPERQKLVLNALLCEIFLSLAGGEQDGLLPRQLSSLQDGYAQLAVPRNLRDGVAFLVDYTGYSRSQLYRLTQQQYHKTPLEIITEIRMNLAKEYLVNSNDTLEMIAEKIGYHSVSQFYHVFRQHFSQTPGAYRRSMKYHLL